MMQKLISVIQLKGETNILYRLITCKVRYFKPLFVIIFMIDLQFMNFLN